MTDGIEGKLKEAEGKITGDEVREKQGQAEQAIDKAKDKIAEKTEDVKQEIRERV